MFPLLPCYQLAKRTQFRPHNHHRIFFDRIIVRLVLLACQLHRKLREFWFDHHSKILLHGTMLKFLLTPRQ